MKFTHDHAPYTVKSVKKGFGHEGYDIYQGKLYKGKQAVAFWQQDGNGGCMRIDPIKYDDKHKALLQEFYDYAEGLTIMVDMSDHGRESFELTNEKDAHVIDEILDVHLNLQWAKRQCKKKVLFRTADDTDEGSFRTFAIKAGQTAQMYIDHIREKYGKDAYILNEAVAQAA